MKKITFLIIALLIITGINAKATLLKGQGTADNPYQITTVADFKFMRDKVNSKDTVYLNKNFKLINDIDFTGDADWIPIGFDYSSSFAGIFDGNSKVISHIKMGSQQHKIDAQYAGLFGSIKNGIVINLGVEWDGIYVSMLSDCSGAGVGGVTGSIYKGSIINCYTTGVIFSTSDKCSFTGGISGRTDDANIINCYSTCRISFSSSSSSSDSYCGGITGRFGSGSIENCYTTGNVFSTSNSSIASGIAGCSMLVMGLPFISNCIALNDTIIAIGPTTTEEKSPFVSRISTRFGGPRFGTNYASQKMIMKRGNSMDNLKFWTDFTGDDHGKTLTNEDIITLLNSWVSSNSSEYKDRFTLKTWKTDISKNRGLPVFSENNTNKNSSKSTPKTPTSSNLK